MFDLVSHKYSLFNLHNKYCTMEWRGPRGLFDDGVNNTNIFINHILYFINFLKNVPKKINNINTSEFIMHMYKIKKHMGRKYISIIVI